ncbi:RNA pyrophosphohydrolase [Croceicoccus sp. F390]|uniref:RNA pyrophosphohydrolase n=1 Tax=Croceicoccus esteveae TaxID=3075597 RepID=A0ABU2ZE55_9SPHN|nr:RNA pyrophosphohydrolase [Croceicoccus sp. F390]MDT0574883.1 RNA pyrophosphohydrolase [Croceicoccus sp. F390]
MNDPDPAQYRPCAGLMIVNDAGRVFVGRRLDAKEGDWWQMPQGGIDEGEDRAAAAMRELWEETGITADKAGIVAVAEEELFYDLPPELQGRLWGGRYVGQRQSWFFIRFTGTDADIDLEAHDPPEFGAYRWVDPQVLPDLIIPFKQPIYRAVLKTFGEQLRSFN